MCMTCNWEETIDFVDDMIESIDYDWAIETLEEIQEWIVYNEHCTNAQIKAIQNIYGSRD